MVQPEQGDAGRYLQAAPDRRLGAAQCDLHPVNRRDPTGPRPRLALARAAAHRRPAAADGYGRAVRNEELHPGPQQVEVIPDILDLIGFDRTGLHAERRGEDLAGLGRLIVAELQAEPAGGLLVLSADPVGTVGQEAVLDAAAEVVVDQYHHCVRLTPIREGHRYRLLGAEGVRIAEATADPRCSQVLCPRTVGEPRGDKRVCALRGRWPYF